MCVKAKSNKLVMLTLMITAALVLMFALCMTDADAVGEITVEVPYEHVWYNYSDDPNVDSTFTYRIIGAADNTVMPIGSEDSGYYFTLTGTISGSLNLIFPFTQEGEYDYIITSYVPEPKTGYTYEPRVYTMKLFVASVDGAMTVYAMTIQDEALSKYDALELDPWYMAGIRVEIPYTQEFHNHTGDPTVDSTFWYILTPVSENAPMPEGSVDGQYVFSITSDVEDMLFLAIDFTEEGTYIYQFTAYVPNPQEGYTYDDNVYFIEIVIGRTVNSLVLESILIKDSTGRVLNEIPLNPAYDAAQEPDTPTPDKPKPDTPKTGDETRLSTYMIIMGVSAALIIGIVIFLIVGKRKKDDDE